MPYTHLKQEDRVLLGAFMRLGHSQAYIARYLGKHPSTISRELQRNCVANKSGYHAATARITAERRRLSANQRCRKLRFDVALQQKIERKLHRGWSPEQIAGTLNVASHVTIYRWIYEERIDLKKYLRSRKGKRRRKHGTATREYWRERQKKRWIDTRPSVVNQRKRFGDWEGDTVVGTDRTSAILTHVERKSGYVLLSKLERATARETKEKTIEAFKKFPRILRQTITYDNGKEFSHHEFIERDTKATVYFAHPYSSWERGCNENANGLLRQYFPKKTSLADVTQQQLDRVARLLNTRPRKRLNWRTPAQVLALH